MAELLQSQAGNESDVFRQAILGGGISGVVCLMLCWLCLVVEFVCLYRRKSNFMLRYFLYLTAACTVYTGERSLYFIHYFIFNEPFDEQFCQALGFLNSYAKLLLLSFMAVLAITILFTVCGCGQRRNPLQSKRKKKANTCFELVFVLVMFTFPLLFCWVPFASVGFGKEGPYCWILKSFVQNGSQFYHAGTLEETFIFLVPMYTAAGMTCVCVLLITVRLCCLFHKTKLFREKQSILLKESCLLVAIFITSISPYYSVLVILSTTDNTPTKWTADLVLFPIAGAGISLVCAFYIFLTVFMQRRTVFMQRRRRGYHSIQSNPKQYKTIPPSTRISLPSNTSQHSPCFLSPSEVSLNVGALEAGAPQGFGAALGSPPEPKFYTELPEPQEPPGSKHTTPKEEW